jgi:hypothetical protein
MPPPPITRSDLRPLRELDRRSAIQRAKYVIRGINNTSNILVEDINNDEINESNEENSNSNFDNHLPAIYPSVYTNIAHSCWEVCRILKGKSKDYHLNDIIGYRMVVYIAL